MRAGAAWLAWALCMAAAAQPPAAETPRRGAGFWSPPVVSPEVLPDRRVVFRLRAPEARQVLLAGITPKPIPMQKDAEGVWSATTDPLPPDLHEYAFVVDGLSIPDPANPRMRPAWRSMRRSLVLVPGGIPWNPVPGAPRGAVTRHVFHSKIAGDERDFYVYTPPGYDARRKRPYPVVYLLHGLGDDARAWIEVGAANATLDTLIHQARAEPMIMVNPLGYGTAGGPADVDREEMLPSYVRILLEEVMPQVERLYNAGRRREERAIAGLSMGGAEALLAGLNHLDRFAWIGSFSGAFNLWWQTRPPEARTAQPGPPNPERLRLMAGELPRVFPKLDREANRRIRLLWISCGTADALIRVNREFKAYLDSIGVQAKYAEIPDAGHVWPLWRRNFADFAELIFK